MSFPRSAPSNRRAEVRALFGRRPDAQLARDVPAIRRFMPFVSPRRNESLVYFAQRLDAEPALRFLEQHNQSRPQDRPVTFFHLLLWALGRALGERPRVNRFVAGGRLWYRDGVWLSFTAKKALDDDSPLIALKQRVDGFANFDEQADAIYDRLATGRSGQKSTADRETDWLLVLPPPLIRVVMAGVRGLDALGLLPCSMIDADPLFASAFVANLGSVGLDAGYHHLWEHGNIPIFCVIGKLQPGPDGRRSVELKWSYDERIEDGLYAMRTLELIRERLEQPEKL